MFLTSWCTLWRYDVIKLSWRHKHRHNQIHTNISERWCGQTICWVGITGVQKHTNNHSIIYNRPILIGIILAIIKMHDSLYKNPLSPPSRMLANKHVLYLYLIVSLVRMYVRGMLWFSRLLRRVHRVRRHFFVNTITSNILNGLLLYFICRLI